MKKRLYRCRQDRQLAGVAGGIAEYLDIDPTVVRVLWILSVFLGGFTLLLYVIMAFIVPLEPIGYGAPVGWPGGPQGPFPGAAGGEGDVTLATGADAATATDAATGGPGAAGASGAGAAGAGAAGAAGAAGDTGWAATGWTGHGWTPPVHGSATYIPHHAVGEAGPRRERGGNAATIFGILLVTFGAIALLGPMIPGWIGGIHLGPAFLLALGIALLVGSLRRSSADR